MNRKFAVLTLYLLLTVPSAFALEMSRCLAFSGDKHSKVDAEFRVAHDEFIRFVKAFPEILSGRADRGDVYILELLDREFKIMRLNSTALIGTLLLINTASKPSLSLFSESLRAVSAEVGDGMRESISNSQIITADLRSDVYRAGASAALRSMKKFYADHSVCL